MDSNLLTLDNLRTAQLVVASGTVSGVATPSVLTPSGGAMQLSSPVWSKFSWANADVKALGNVTTGAFSLFTLPKRSVITRFILSITAVAAGTTDLTVAVGLNGGAADGFVTAESCQAVAQWGLDPSDLGGLLTNKFSLPSMTANSPVDLTFVTTDIAKKLKDVTGCAGDVFIETVVLP